MMKFLAAAAAAIALVPSALAQQGPAQIPPSGGNNVVFPTLERPADGWPEGWRLGGMDDICGAQFPAILRVSRIIGTREGYNQAQADHIAWYEENGFSENTITEIPVVLPNLDGGAFSVQGQIALTLHINRPGPDATRAAREDEDADSAWTAFVEAYRANSEIIEEAWVCIDRGMIPSVE